MVPAIAAVLCGPLFARLQMIQDASLLVTEEIANLSGPEFERHVGATLRQLGYQRVKQTKATGDYGTDIIAIAP